jgi:hypothetical protein
MDESNKPDEPPVMPRWIPIVIGVVLVLIAALAVWTGLQYRHPTLANDIVKSRRPPRPMTGAGPPGEPEPGSSLMFPGEAPTASAPVAGKSRTQISGGAEGITVVTRMWARRGMSVTVTPEDAIVYVNDTPIGQASQWAGGVYEFAQPGSYTVRLVAPGYKEQMFVVTAAENAKEELAHISAKLERTQ